VCARGSNRALPCGPSDSALEPLRNPVLVLGTVAIALLAGCGRPAAYEQEIGGSLERDGHAATSVRVRFISSNTQQTCGEPNVEALTDDQGRFRFQLRYEPLWFERIDVVIHPYRLCVFEGSSWRSLWDLTTGPAPRHVDFRCKTDAVGKPPCEVLWNDQPWPAR
jgi:hypothetical protein